MSSKAENDILMKFGCVEYTDTILKQIDKSFNIRNSLNDQSLDPESTYVSPSRKGEDED